jgi:DNA-binding transcriptional LysR family regulator
MGRILVFSVEDGNSYNWRTIFSFLLKMKATDQPMRPARGLQQGSAMTDLADMQLFVQAIASGSLSAAGRILHLSPAVASKRLSRLEERLRVRLVQRTSRRLALTEEGALYFERCQAILADVAEAEAALAQGRQEASGILRVSATVALGRRWVGPALADFALANPQVAVHLSLSDSIVDLVDGRFDCAVRIGGAEDSRLVARTLAENRRVLCAAPAYLARHGAPSRPGELVNYDCIVAGWSPSVEWVFCSRRPDAGPETSVRIQGRFVADNGEQAHDWVVAGLGLARLSIWDVVNELADGRLVAVLPEWSGNTAPIQAVFPTRQFLPLRTRRFIDLLVERFAQARASLFGPAGELPE